MVFKIVSGINTAVEGIDPICRMLNIYLGAVCAVMLVDIAYSYIMMFANDKNQLKLISALAFVGAGAVFKVFGFFPGMNKTEVTIQSSQTSTKLKTKFHCKKVVILSIYKHQ